MQGNDPYLEDPYHVEMILCQERVVISEKPSAGHLGGMPEEKEDRWVWGRNEEMNRCVPITGP